MPQLKLRRQTLVDNQGYLSRIKALIINEAYKRSEPNLRRALVLVSNDVSAIVIDCIERIQCDDCLFAQTELQKGGDDES